MTLYDLTRKLKATLDRQLIVPVEAVEGWSDIRPRAHPEGLNDAGGGCGASPVNDVVVLGEKPLEMGFPVCKRTLQR